MCLLFCVPLETEKRPIGALSQRSLANSRRAETAHILPVRGCLEEVNRLMRGDFYIGKGSRQRSLKRSTFANGFQSLRVWPRDSDLEIQGEDGCGRIITSNLMEAIGSKTYLPLQCETSMSHGVTPTSRVLNYLALLRQEAGSESGPSADEGAPGPGAGWVGEGEPMMVGSGCTIPAACDGLSLSSPGRWAPHARKYPTTEHWRELSGLFMDFARRHGSADLLMKFALGKVEESPFGAEVISILKSRVIESLSTWGCSLKSSPQDRTDLPIDYRFLELLLDASGDPEVGLGLFASGVRYPKPVVASLGAQRKGQEGWNLHCPRSCSTARIGYRSTNGTRVREPRAITDCRGHQKTSQREGKDVREDVRTYSRCGGSSSASTD